MSSYSASLDIDANRKQIESNEAFRLVAPWTFVAGTTGATGQHTVFTVTGDVIVTVVGICNTTLTGATATISVGTAGNVAAILGLTTATNIVANDVWLTASTPADVGATPGTFVVANGADITFDILTTAITGGVLDVYCLWRPLSTDASITVTTPA